MELLTQLPEYRPKRLLNKVFDKEIEETIALKLLNPEIAADEEIIKRFRNELKLARQITHKNVCRMFDLGKSEATNFITMEYVSGEDLKSFVRRAGPLSIGKSLLIALLGAAYATRGHRDKAQELLEGLKKQAGQNYVMPFYIAIIYLGLGEKTQVFEWLERAYEERNYWLVFLKADPMFDSLHSEPRFRTLLGNVGLKE